MTAFSLAEKYRGSARRLVAPFLLSTKGPDQETTSAYPHETTKTGRAGTESPMRNNYPKSTTDNKTTTRPMVAERAGPKDQHWKKRKSRDR